MNKRKAQIWMLMIIVISIFGGLFLLNEDNEKIGYLTYPVHAKVTENASGLRLLPDSDFGEVTAGTIISKEITFTNHENFPVFATYNKTGYITNFITIENFTIAPKEEIVISVALNLPKETMCKEYFGEITFTFQKLN